MALLQLSIKTIWNEVFTIILVTLKSQDKYICIISKNYFIWKLPKSKSENTDFNKSLPEQIVYAGKRTFPKCVIVLLEELGDYKHDASKLPSGPSGLSAQDPRLVTATDRLKIDSQQINSFVHVTRCNYVTVKLNGYAGSHTAISGIHCNSKLANQLLYKHRKFSARIFSLKSRF